MSISARMRHVLLQNVMARTRYDLLDNYTAPMRCDLLEKLLHCSDVIYRETMREQMKNDDDVVTNYCMEIKIVSGKTTERFDAVEI